VKRAHPKKLKPKASAPMSKPLGAAAPAAPSPKAALVPGVGKRKLDR
jgi:hypothetical protein